MLKCEVAKVWCFVLADLTMHHRTFAFRKKMQECEGANASCEGELAKVQRFDGQLEDANVKV